MFMIHGSPFLVRKSCFHGQSALGCCLESLGVTSVGALYHVASEEPDSNEGVQYFLAAQEHGGARSGSEHARTNPNAKTLRSAQVRRWL